MSRVWRNGSLVDGDANPGVFPAGALLFETIALREGRVECLDDHLARLRHGLAHLGIRPRPLASGDLNAWRSALTQIDVREGILRLVVGGDFEELGARDLLPSPATFSLRTLRTVRDAPEWLPRPKSAPWANSLAATVELRGLGVSLGTEGVQLDARGHVSEGSRSSIVWVRGGLLHVPAAATGRLPGTALAQLVACAGLPVREVCEPPPSEAEVVLVLRSTLPGGGAPADSWTNVDGHGFWQAADLRLARDLLARLAAWRAQRAVKLA